VRSVAFPHKCLLNATISPSTNQSKNHIHEKFPSINKHQKQKPKQTKKQCAKYHSDFELEE
jgi:hypothetical protein